MKAQLLATIVVVGALALFGASVGTYPTYLISLALINVVSALGLNLLTGNSGQISLCHTSFMAIGAYGSTLMSTHFGLPFWLAVPAAAACSALVGAALGYPASRLSGLYLALATLGFLQIVQLGIEELSDITGGVSGLKVPGPVVVPGLPVSEYAMFLIILAVCVAAIWMTGNLLRSQIGRELNAVRQSPHAAAALGVSVARVRLSAFAMAAAYAGVAGGLMANLVGFIDPIEFGISAALRHITFIVVGGMGSVAGSVIGATVLSGLPELLRPVKEYGDVIYTVILLFFLLFMPRGLVVVWARAMASLRRGRRAASPVAAQE
ncbi:MAG: branched-chain amino acid ABC transporter permease [Lautropia sp.]